MLCKEDDIMIFMGSKILIGIIAILAGLLILFVPDIIGWVIGICLIVFGILMLSGKK